MHVFGVHVEQQCCMTVMSVSTTQPLGLARQRSCTDLLPFEDVLIELLLQALIGQINAQLLKAILFEALKTIDVQNSYTSVASLPRTCM